VHTLACERASVDATFGCPLVLALLAGAVGEEAYHHYQICVVRHDHPHELSIALRTLNKGGDADLYLSTTRVRPTASSSTWVR
jgi:hypothetical protein